MGLLHLLNGQKSAANEKEKAPSGESKPNPGQKPSGERQKRDVLGHAGGYVGGWDHPIDSTLDWAKSQWNDANWLADVVNRNGAPILAVVTSSIENISSNRPEICRWADTTKHDEDDGEQQQKKLFIGNKYLVYKKKLLFFGIFTVFPSPRACRPKSAKLWESGVYKSGGQSTSKIGDDGQQQQMMAFRTDSEQRAMLAKIIAAIENISNTADEQKEGTSAAAANASDTQIGQLINSRQLKTLIREQIDEMEKQQEKKWTTYNERIGELEKQQKQQQFGLENFVVTALETQQMEQQQKQMQISQKISGLDNMISILKDRFGNELLKSIRPNVRNNFVEKFSNAQANYWDAKACHSELEITGAECLTVRHKGKGNELLFCSVFAQSAIPSSDSGIFYYEMKILSLKDFARIGIATKAMALDRKVGSCTDSFAYGSSGCFWVNTSCWINLKNEFRNDDIVGCGINLTNGRIIFTKNGQRLDTSEVFAPETICPLFPCVTLGSSNDKVEANFGPTFKFNLSKTEVLLNSLKQNFYWDGYHPDLEINGAQVYYSKRNGNEWRSVFLNCPIASRAFDAIFYFEMNVLNVKNFVLFGFSANRQKTPNDETNTFSYRNDGKLWADESLLIGGEPVEQFVAGDIVGCGINMARRRIIFTKNGRRIGATIILDPPPVHPLFPFISLHDFGDLIKANFGASFKFDLSIL
ncbi:hypothetical protein niasHT_032623 [Heterodera trifolii]|uniref:B30.2/SPRY domain-containing protein n=1 Tax=Heterodera trifolii TaxID=157864 RepID=A0ABD2I9S0_9BILA